MKISLGELLTTLGHNNLSFMADSNGTTGGIEQSEMRKVVSRINSVLRRLYTNFNINQQHIHVLFTADNNRYPLVKGADYIVENLGYAFEEEVRQILSVEYESGYRPPLGELIGNGNIRLADHYQTLVLGTEVPRGLVTVSYKPVVPQFDVNDCELVREITFPESLIDVLGYGVAAKTYEGLGSMEGSQQASLAWAKFEAGAKEAEANNSLAVAEFEQNNRLRQRGFR